MSADNFPILVIEHSSLLLKDIVDLAIEQKVSSTVLANIKSKEICVERLFRSSATVYALYPSTNQAYLALDLRQPHYQVYGGSKGSANIVALRKAVTQAKQRRGNSCKLIEITPDMDEYRDEFLWVKNHADLSSVDKEMVHEKLNGTKKDPERNNFCVDLGYAGQHNSKREARYLGLTHPNKLASTSEDWSKELFRRTTALIDNLFSELSVNIYNDDDRNKLFASEIDPTNRIEALRLASTNKDTLLKMHCDNGNCETAGYSWVAGFGWMTDGDASHTREVIITYGKRKANEHMMEREKHREAILFFQRIFGELPDLQKSQGSDVFSRDKERIKYNYAFLDKGIFYSLFGTATEKVFKRTPALRYNLRMACAFLANVTMSECGDHYWQMLEDILNGKLKLSDVPIEEMDPLEVGWLMVCEIWRRKIGPVDYPTHRRHPPAVNRCPTREQMDKTILAIEKLILELREIEHLIDNTANAIHYYGRASEFLVEEAYGAGHLTAMHIIGVATCLGLMPAKFLSVAEVGVSTRPWKFLKWAFGYTDENCYDDTNVLLRALSVLLMIPIMWVEELICIATKLVAPHEGNYDDFECTINFRNVTINLHGGKGSGDVIYRGMLLFRVTETDVIYHLDCNGSFERADKLLYESVYSRICYVPDEKFWSRKFGRKFYYTRAKAGNRISSIRDYFRTPLTNDEYIPSRHNNRRNLGSDREEIAFGLFGPSRESVFVSTKAREPLNIQQLVWKALGGEKSFRVKDMADFICNPLEIWRPPSVAPPFRALQNRRGFYSCTLVPQRSNIRVNLHEGRYWPSHKFDMLPYVRHQPSTDAPAAFKRPVANQPTPDDTAVEDNNQRRTNRKRTVDHSTRTEPCYAWNQCRLLRCASSPHGYILAFQKKHECLYFALMEFFFNNPHLFDLDSPQVRSLYFQPSPNMRGPYRQLERNRLSVDTAMDVRIFFDSNANGSRKHRAPFLIAIRYPRGGLLYYFCDGTGQRLSHPFLRRPVSRAKKEADGNTNDKMYEFLCIIDHKTKGDRTQHYEKCSINVVLKWIDGSFSEESMLRVFETSPLEVVDYAERNKLLKEPGWSRVKTASDVYASYKKGRERAISDAMSNPVPKAGTISSPSTKRPKNMSP